MFVTHIVLQQQPDKPIEGEEQADAAKEEEPITQSKGLMYGSPGQLA